MFREREGKRILALAKKAGAKVVEFEYRPDGVKATIRLDHTSAEMAEEPERNEWLEGDDAHQA
jgi:hypothetical protein